MARQGRTRQAMLTVQQNKRKKSVHLARKCKPRNVTRKDTQVKASIAYEGKAKLGEVRLGEAKKGKCRSCACHDKAMECKAREYKEIKCKGSLAQD